MATKRLTPAQVTAVKAKATKMTAYEVQALAADLAATRAAVDKTAVQAGGWSAVAMGGSGMAKVDSAKTWHVGLGSEGGRDLWGVGYKVDGGRSYWQTAGQICGFHRGYWDAARSVVIKERALANGSERILPGSVCQYPAYLVPNDKVSGLAEKLALAYVCWVNAVDAKQQIGQSNLTSPEISTVTSDDAGTVDADTNLPIAELSTVNAAGTDQSADTADLDAESHIAEESLAPTVEGPETLADVEETRRHLDVDGELQKRVEVLQRTEQSLLRKELLNGSTTGECALCGRVIDSRLLVAAHIKKRSLCTEAEKRDVPNIVMLNCKFGCDDLYEHGLISVATDWQIKTKPSLTDETALRYIKEALRGPIVPRPESERYFAWHRHHHDF